LDKAKEIELKMRNKICSEILVNKIKGTKTENIGKYKVSATAKLNTKIDKAELAKLWENLTTIEKAAITFKPELIAKNYNRLDKKCLIHKAVIAKPGTPALAAKEI
jgi:hypothetical protein